MRIDHLILYATQARALKGKIMKTIQIILLLTASMILEAAKITWTKDGKPKIEESKKPIEGCQNNDILSTLLDTNATRPVLESNLTKLCKNMN